MHTIIDVRELADRGIKATLIQADDDRIEFAVQIEHGTKGWVPWSKDAVQWMKDQHMSEIEREAVVEAMYRTFENETLKAIIFG